MRDPLIFMLLLGATTTGLMLLISYAPRVGYVLMQVFG